MHKIPRASSDGHGVVVTLAGAVNYVAEGRFQSLATMSYAIVASLIFFVVTLTAAAVVEFPMRVFVEAAGLNGWVIVLVPALIAALYALLLFRRPDGTGPRLAGSLLRAILVMLLTWLSLLSLVNCFR